jgi:hypothetical protein
MFYCLMNIYIIFYKIKFIPLHDSPLDDNLYPSKHVHWYEPSLLEQNPFLHIPDISEHSSISAMFKFMLQDVANT